jgi:hypothetical protein
MTPKLTPTEFKILRRDLAAVNALFRRGLIGMKGGQVIVLDAGEAVLQEHQKHISQVRAQAGRAGGPARAEALTPKRRKQIARAGAEAKHSKGGEV